MDKEIIQYCTDFSSKTVDLDTTYVSSNIPKCLQEFIKQCSIKEANELWHYFDVWLVSDLIDFILVEHRLE